MQDEVISVIVPVYNVAQYLDRCIQSILDQTYRNLEIILVDDGSRDSSGAICDLYAQKDGRIRVIHKENGGLSDARNKGLDLASGRYLAFADSDDYLDKGMLEALYESLRAEDADMSMCNACMVNENYEKIPGWNRLGPITYGVLSGKDATQKVLEELGGYYVVSWNKLYKRELFDKVRFPYGRVNEDEYVIHRLYGQCRRVVCLKESLYFYLQRGNSIMGRIKKGKDGDHLLNQACYMHDRMRYLKAIGENACAAEAYRKMFLLYLKLCALERADALDPVMLKRRRKLKKLLWANKNLLRYINWKKKLGLVKKVIDYVFGMLCVNRSGKA